MLPPSGLTSLPLRDLVKLRDFRVPVLTVLLLHMDRCVEFSNTFLQNAPGVCMEVIPGRFLNCCQDNGPTLRFYRYRFNAAVGCEVLGKPNRRFYFFSLMAYYGNRRVGQVSGAGIDQLKAGYFSVRYDPGRTRRNVLPQVPWPRRIAILVGDFVEPFVSNAVGT